MTTLAAPPLSPPPPSPPLMTAAEFVARYEQVHAELVKGVVKEYPVPFPQHGKLCATLTALLWTHARSHDLGHVMSNDSWIQTGRNPDTVRGADVCFFSYERLAKGPVPRGLLAAVPDLVVEVKSPSDRWNDIFIKVGEYLNAGVRAVVIFDPDSLTASVYRPDVQQRILNRDDELTLPEVLPDFTLRVGGVFE